MRADDGMKAPLWWRVWWWVHKGWWVWLRFELFWWDWKQTETRIIRNVRAFDPALGEALAVQIEELWAQTAQPKESSARWEMARAYLIEAMERCVERGAE